VLAYLNADALEAAWMLARRACIFSRIDIACIKNKKAKQTLGFFNAAKPKPRTSYHSRKLIALVGCESQIVSLVGCLGNQSLRPSNIAGSLGRLTK
jgi:hypothetical protein